jgi:hypothetical protein
VFNIASVSRSVAVNGMLTVQRSRDNHIGISERYGPLDGPRCLVERGNRRGSFGAGLYRIFRAFSLHGDSGTAWVEAVAHARKLTIRSETVPYTSCIQVGVEKRAPQPVAGATLPSKDADIDVAIANYLQLNNEARLLKRAFRIDLPYELTSKDDSWVQKDPDTGGLIEVSAVGFNADKTVAVVYMGHHCGNLCGGGAVRVLVKSQGRWQPYGRVMGGIIGCPWAS